MPSARNVQVLRSGETSMRQVIPGTARKRIRARPPDSGSTEVMAIREVEGTDENSTVAEVTD